MSILSNNASIRKPNILTAQTAVKPYREKV